jgi:methionyl-tRNA formyltransferase
MISRMTRLRIIFMGTAELSRPILEALLKHQEFEVVAVVTQPDKPKGRDLKLQPSPVKETALKSGLPVLQPEKARDAQFVEELRGLHPDLIAVAAYGQILPQSILDLPRFGCLNVHTSLLPKYRGAAPIQWAILNDEAETGVTIMKMDAGLDTGDIVSIEKTPIQPQDNSQILHDRLAQMGAGLLVRTISDFVAGKIQPRPQPHEGVSHVSKIKKEDGKIDWSLPARVIWNRVRAFTPWPGAFTFIQGTSKSRMIKIWEAMPVEGSGNPGEILKADKAGIVVACGEKALSISRLQREGGKQLAVQDFLAGNAIAVGTKLG